MANAVSAETPPTRASEGGDSSTVQCWQCGAAQPPAPLCRSCNAVLPLTPDADHYQVFGIPRRLALAESELAGRYYELSRLLHPDGHGSGRPEARDASTTNTAALTRAYRTLRDPVARARYWLELHGENLGDDNRVPGDLAALVFEVQERLEQLRDASGPARAQRAADVRSELEALEARDTALGERMDANFRQWDAAHEAPVLLRELRSILSHRAYLATLIRDVRVALDRAEAAEPRP